MNESANPNPLFMPRTYLTHGEQQDRVVAVPAPAVR